MELLVALAAGMLLLRVGLALYTCGLVRAKNAGGSLLRHVADVCLTTLGFWAVGIAILLPKSGGGSISSLLRWQYLFGLHGSEWRGSAWLLFLMVMAALLASGIVVGALSERSRFWPSLAPGVLLGSVILPILSRWVAGGWLGRLHFHDYAGASFIHLAGGVCAAVGAVWIGPRGGKYNRDGSSNVIPGHNLPLAGAGALLMIAAWFSYLLAFSGAGGPAYLVAVIALNALLAAAGAGAASLAVAHVRYGKPDIYLTLTGVLGGLVSISAGADVMSAPAAVLTGVIAGTLICTLLLQIDLVWKIDDPTGALAIHGIGGAWGVLAAGILGSWDEPMSWFARLGVQLLGLIAVTAFVAASTAVLLLILKRLVALRSREADEFDGLDLA